MVYIRTKKIKGEDYLYLVRSIWDAKKASSRQEIIKYLGNAQAITLQDIPSDYRTNPKIAAFLSSNVGKSVKQKEILLSQIKKNIFNCLTNGERDEMVKIYEAYTKSSTPDEFLEKILSPVMYEVGNLWAAKKLSVASEHIASNMAHDLVKIIGKQIARPNVREKILICTPHGEEHNLGCNILESFLQSKGYRTFNLSPSAPTESIISFIGDNYPDIILVSITLEENIKAGQRLVKKITEKFDVPIFIGGQALENKNLKFDGTVIQEKSLSKLYNLLRT